MTSHGHIARHQRTDRDGSFLRNGWPLVTLLLALLPAATDAQTFSETGRWRGPYPTAPSGSLGYIGTHVAVLKGPADTTRALVFGGTGTGQKFGVWSFVPGDSLTVPKTAGLGYPATEVNLHGVVRPAHDLFCSGHASLNGRLVIVGGEYLPPVGTETAYEFNPLYTSPTHSDVWQMLEGTASGRWYPSVLGLSNRLMAFSGTKWSYWFTFGGEAGAQGLKNDLRPLGMGNQVEWTDPNPTGPPAERRDHTAIMNDGGQLEYFKHMVVFGGETATEKRNDVWANYLNGDDVTTRWVPFTITPDPVADLPLPRSRHTAIYRAVNDALPAVPDTNFMYVYGGRDSSDNALGDVWKLTLIPSPNAMSNSGIWTRLLDNSNAGPGNRYGHTAILDLGVGDTMPRMLVFGGRTSATSLATTDTVWSLNLKGSPQQWTPISVTGVPPGPREGHGAVGDKYELTMIRRFRMVIFGGHDGSNPLDETWSLSRQDNQNAWTWAQLNPPGPIPPPRWRAATGRDGLLDRMVVFGGEGDSLLDDVWTLDLGDFATTPSWSQPAVKNPGATPAKRAGHTGVPDLRAIVERVPELYHPATDTWQQLPTASLLQDRLYPFMFVLPSGNAFDAGPRQVTRVLNTSSWTWGSTDTATYNDAGSAVMYRPGSVLRCGRLGADALAAVPNTDTIRFSGPNDVTNGWWQVSTAVDNRMLPRKFHNLTLLPTGDVLVTGGLGTNDSSSAVKKPQIWKPTTNPVSWNNHDIPAEPAIRNYHSAAILLPCGRVLSTGGEIFADEDMNPYRDMATILEPPYLFNGNAYATRPVIANAPCRINYGQEFFIRTPDLAGMAGGTVCLVRPGAVTHDFNEDQRYVPLDMYECASTGRLRVVAPADSGIAPSGDYLLFIVKKEDPNNNYNRVPSIGRWVRVGPSPQPPPVCDVDVPNRVNAPQPIVDIESPSEIWFFWTAPYDNPGVPSGTVAKYDVRASTGPIANDEAFCQADTGSAQAPLSAGGQGQYGWVSGLWPCTEYHLALKARDGTGNWSPISNQSVWTTMCWGGGGGGGFIAQPGATLAGAIPVSGDGARSLSGTSPLLAGATNDVAEPLGLTSPTAAAWAVEMGLADDAPVWSIYALGEDEARSLLGSDSAGIVVQSPEEQGQRLTRARLYPGAGSTRFALRHPHRPGRLVFRAPYEFRQARAAVHAGTPGEVYEVASARHSRLGDQTAVMDLMGSTTASLVPGDTLRLAYQRSQSAAEGAQDWFMLIGEPGSLAPIAGSRRALTPKAPTLPVEFALHANQPNPFSRLTSLRFALPRSEHVRLEVFDLLGRRVSTLADGRFEAGEHAITWDGRGAHGALLSAGVYAARIQAGEFRARRTMVLLPSAR